MLAFVHVLYMATESTADFDSLLWTVFIELLAVEAGCPLRCLLSKWLRPGALPPERPRPLLEHGGQLPLGFVQQMGHPGHCWGGVEILLISTTPQHSGRGLLWILYPYRPSVRQLVVLAAASAEPHFLCWNEVVGWKEASQGLPVGQYCFYFHTQTVI